MEDEFAVLYNDILDKKGDYRLVNNDVFIRWAGSYQDYPSTVEVPSSVELPAFVQLAFYSDQGANQIET